MRIITGTAKGFRLKTPKGLHTRPTADRVKESIFNILGKRLQDARVLDLFSGTGNLGLEAISRGASKAVLVDQVTASLIEDNANHTRLADKTKILRMDVYRVLEQYIQDNQQFDLIFCDPPYNEGHGLKVLSRIDKSALLAEKGVFILEHSRHELITSNLDRLEMVRSEKYGETVVSFYQYKFL